jgi:translation initiation factor IF-1
MTSSSFVMRGKVILVINSYTSKVLLNNNLEVIATLAGKIKNRQIFPEDVVDVELSPYDLKKGRIINVDGLKQTFPKR